MKKTALITGITGQDGSYLAEFLLRKNYQVHGVKRRSSTVNNYRIDEIYKNFYENMKPPKFFLHYGDVTDSLNISELVNKIEPDEIYNLAAQSHVKVSFETPEYTANADGLGVLRILEAIRRFKKKKLSFIKHQLQKCLEVAAHRNQRKQTLYLKVLMVQQNYMAIGSQKYIEKVIISLRAVEYYLTTSLH